VTRPSVFISRVVWQVSFVFDKNTKKSSKDTTRPFNYKCQYFKQLFTYTKLPDKPRGTDNRQKALLLQRKRHASRVAVRVRVRHRVRVRVWIWPGLWSYSDLDLDLDLDPDALPELWFPYMDPHARRYFLWNSRASCHGLRVSISTGLTSTCLVNERWQFSTPTAESRPLDRSAETVAGDYVGGFYSCAKFGANPSMWCSGQMSEI